MRNEAFHRRQEIEYRYVSAVEAEGRTIAGRLVKYNEVIELRNRGREKYAVQCFDPIPRAVFVNKQHVRSDVLAKANIIDSSEELRMEAKLPITNICDDVLTMIKEEVLNGLSIEFRAVKLLWDGRCRIVEKAVLCGIGIVDIPAIQGTEISTRSAKPQSLRRMFY